MNYASLFNDLVLVQSKYKDLFLWIVALLAIFSIFSIAFLLGRLFRQFLTTKSD